MINEARRILKENLHCIGDVLNTMYCTRAHLAERLSEFDSFFNIAGLDETLAAGVAANLADIKALEAECNRLGMTCSVEQCAPLITYLESVCNPAYLQPAEQNGYELLHYLRIGNCIVNATCKQLTFLAHRINNQLITQLMADCAARLTHLTDFEYVLERSLGEGSLTT